MNYCSLSESFEETHKGRSELSSIPPESDESLREKANKEFRNKISNNSAISYFFDEIIGLNLSHDVTSQEYYIWARFTPKSSHAKELEFFFNRDNFSHTSLHFTHYSRNNAYEVTFAYESKKPTLVSNSEVISEAWRKSLNGIDNMFEIFQSFNMKKDFNKQEYINNNPVEFNEGVLSSPKNTTDEIIQQSGEYVKPAFEGIVGQLGAVEHKLDSQYNQLNGKLDSQYNQLLNAIKAL